MLKKSWLFVLCATLVAAVIIGCSFRVSNKDTTQAVKPTPEPTPLVVEKKAKVQGNKIEISEKIMFAANEETIREQSFSLLEEIAELIHDHAEIDLIRIEGHTDSDGRAKYNKKLSRDRANAVKNYLVVLGVNANRLEAVGYGEEQPISDNDTEDGKEKNRRVEFRIIEDQSALLASKR